MSDSEKKPWFSVFPSASQLPPELNKPSFGFKMDEVDVINGYNKAHGVAIARVNEDVRAWVKEEANSKGWQRIVWGVGGKIEAIYPNGL